MNLVENCKKCKCYCLDTLVDGTKEDYCYPPETAMCFTIPCKDRGAKMCEAIRKLVKKG